MKKVSCIICAYNEEPRIGNVLKAVLNHPILDEIIVVDDSSTDNTSREALKFKGVRVIRHKKNLGKTRSMLDGCKNAKNEVVMFLDADLIDLTYDNIMQLVKPVLMGLVDMTMAICKYNFPVNALIKLVDLELISGQRVLKREMAIKNLKNVPGYGAEVKINQYILDNNLKFLTVKWLNVRAATRQKERDIIKSVRSHIIGFRQLVTTISFTKIIKQILIMGKLSAKYKKELNIGYKNKKLT